MKKPLKKTVAGKFEDCVSGDRSPTQDEAEKFIREYRKCHPSHLSDDKERLRKKWKDQGWKIYSAVDGEILLKQVNEHRQVPIQKEPSKAEIERRKAKKAESLERSKARITGKRAEGIPSEQYGRLEARGFKPDENGRVLCGSPKTPGGPCTSVEFIPLKGKLIPLIHFRSFEGFNQKAYSKLKDHKKSSQKAPRLWDDENNRPSHDFLVIQTVNEIMKGGGAFSALEGYRNDFGDEVLNSISRLDSAPIIRIAKGIERLKELESLKAEEDKKLQRINAVMNAFQNLCRELLFPPTKKQLRDASSLKVEGGKPGTLKGLDESQFTTKFINPLGLHWLPKGDQNRR